MRISCTLQRRRLECLAKRINLLSTTDSFWKRKARLVAWRWNFAMWLNLFLRFGIVASFAMMCALLITRRAEVKSMLPWEIYGGAMLLGAVICLVMCRKNFLDLRSAFVRLDATLKLHNRLTAAADGVGDWPPEALAARDGLRWRWPRVLTPLLASAGALLFAAMVPIPHDKGNDGRHKEEPLAWSRIESELETLKKEDVVKEEAIKNLEEQVEELRKQSPDNWYSHSSLEASDNLREKTEDAIRALQRDMEKASNTLDSAQQNSGMLNADQLQKLGDQFQQSLQGLQLGTLPLNKELLDQLKNIDPSKLQNLTPGQLAQLQKCLKQGISGCKLCLGQGDKEYNALVALINQTGNGGKGGGGGPAPLGLKEDQTKLHTKKTTQLSNEDLSHAAVGDLMGVSKGEHKIDTTKYAGPSTAGTIQSNGAGGEAVWKNQLTPQEREILERFYK